MKDWRPQIIVGVLVLGAIAYIALQSGFDQVAILAVGGIVAAVTALSANGKSSA